MKQMHLMVGKDEEIDQTEAIRRIRLAIEKNQCPVCGKSLNFFDDKDGHWEYVCPGCHWSCGV